MQPQLFIGTETPRPEKLKPVEQGMRQPNGGLWTSTPDVEKDSFWVTVFAQRGKSPFAAVHGRWGSHTGKALRCWHLYPRTSARVATIDSLPDLMSLGQKYGWHVGDWYWASPPFGEVIRIPAVHSLDFIKLAAHFDAICVTERGVEQAEGRAAGKYRLAFFHAESTCWFRWCFDRVEEVGGIADYVKNPERGMTHLIPQIMRSYADDEIEVL